MINDPSSPTVSRRGWLKAASCGLGALTVTGLAPEGVSAGLLSPRESHFAPKAKRVIFLFMAGGPSQFESFDHKPSLQAGGGKTGLKKGKLLAPLAKFAQHGASGMWVSDAFPHLAEQADELCLLNAASAPSRAHPIAIPMMHTGAFQFVRPSLGAWVVYGLGTENQDLPGFFTIKPTRTFGGPSNYGSAFLPSTYQATRLGWEGNDAPLAEGAWPIMAPSPLAYAPANQVPREMSRADMDAVRDDFVRAASLADAAGMDLLEVHMAHGYLLASFISPLTNRRTDEYGGSLDNRMRFPLEVFDAVRAAWPQSKPMSVRISAVDWAPGGTTPEDAVAVARLLKEHGCDIVDVSAGQTVPDASPVYGRQFQTPFSDRIRLEVDIPTMTVGNISSYEDANSILAAGRADLVVMARAHLWNPYWTRHAAQALGHELPWPEPYAVLNQYTPRER